MKFKAGQKVKCISSCSGSKAGHIYTLEVYGTDKTELVAAVKRPDGTTTGCMCKGNWELIIDISKEEINAL